MIRPAPDRGTARTNLAYHRLTRQMKCAPGGSYEEDSYEEDSHEQHSYETLNTRSRLARPSHARRFVLTGRSARWRRRLVENLYAHGQARSARRHLRRQHSRLYLGPAHH